MAKARWKCAMAMSLPSRSLARFRTFSTRSCRGWVIGSREKGICRSRSKMALSAPRIFTSMAAPSAWWERATPIFPLTKSTSTLEMTKEVLLGAHMSIAGGVHMAIERACSINCTAMQIFVKNNMQWFARPLSTDEIREFLDHQQRAQLGSVFAHANYLINLAATNPQFHANSLRALAEELIRADHLEL